MTLKIKFDALKVELTKIETLNTLIMKSTQEANKKTNTPSESMNEDRKKFRSWKIEEKN